MKTMRMLIKRLILLLAFLIFLGYIMIWCVIPLDVWFSTWLSTMVKKTDTKEFGTAGTFMLIFTVPILLIALLGCLYLYLTRDVGRYEDGVKNDRLAALRRPMLVRGPLGVVSAVELIFLLIFIALLIWTIVYTNARLPVVHNMNPRQNRRHANDKLWQQKLRTTAFYCGILANLCCAFLFFPVTRVSSILALVGLTSERSVKYHIWLGHTIMLFCTAHALLFVVYWGMTYDLGEMIIWDHHSVSNIPGEIALLFGLAMWVTAHPWIRRKMYELFYYTHHLYIPFMFFYLLHVGFHSFCMILPGFYLFMVDRLLRYLQSRRKVRLVSARILPCDAVELNFAKSLTLDYNPTSFVSINIPSVSSMQWHPFSVSSNSSLEPDKLSVIIKKNGTWSQKVVETISSSAQIERVAVGFEGPYGPVSNDFLRYETLVMIAGGSGISPMISIIRELIYGKATRSCRTPRVVLICSFKHSAQLTLLNLILPINATTLDLSQIQLEIEAFVTRDKHPAIDNINSQVKTVWFRPHPCDEPISAVLGPKTWLWLGAILLSSFVMFLIIIGNLGRFYIYPIDKNTNKSYSWTARASLDALFICVSIIATSTVAVLFNKRRSSGMVGSQVQHIELASPVNSPRTRFHNPDCDLERLLAENTFFDNTKIHYGQRPNIKKILLDFEGPNTGVVVCGPGQMRHEVARICSSGLADNLHYESISYNS